VRDSATPRSRCFTAGFYSPDLSLDYWLVLLSRCAAISFFSSSGVSFGRSIDSVILSIFPVKANGTW